MSKPHEESNAKAPRRQDRLRAFALNRPSASLRLAFRLRLAYGGQDGGQAIRNSTLQNSLAVKPSAHSRLATAKAEI